MIKINQKRWIRNCDIVNDEVVKNKSKSRAHQSGNDTAKLLSGDDRKLRAYDRLMELEIPKSTKATISKLLVNGHLTSVDKIIFQNDKSIIVQAKVNPQDKRFKIKLQSEHAVIKIFVDGNHEEIQKRMDYEWDILSQDNRPHPLVKLNNMIVMTMVGGDEPALTLREVLKSKQQNIVSAYRGIMQIWHHVRLTKFESLEFVWCDGKLFTLGTGEDYDPNVDGDMFDFMLTNLKACVDHYCKRGLTRKQAEEVYFECHANYDSYSRTLTRTGIHGKRQTESPFHED